MKQFLRHIFLLLALCVAITPAWSDDCTYTKTLNGSSHTSKDFNHTICSTTSEAPNVAVSIKYTISLKKTTLGKDLTYTLYAIDNSNQQHEIASGLKVENGQTVTVEKSFNLNKDITSFKIDQTSGKFGGNREITISNVTVTYKYASSLTTGKSHFTIDDTPVGASSSVSFSVDYQNSTNTLTMVANESSDVNNSFSISPSSKTLTDCSGTIDYTVTFSPLSEMENATATYVISGNGSSLTVNVTATSFATVNPEYTCNIADSYMVDAPAIDLNTLWISTSTAQKHYKIESWTPFGINNTNAVQPAISNNILSLGQAGTLVLSLSQPETEGYYASSDTKIITINKYVIEAFICQSSALRNEIINNPFSLSYGLTDFNVESKNADIAEYNKDTKQIQTYFTDGTASFQIIRPEDYKYNELDKTLTLEVYPAGGCLVLEPCSGSCYVPTGGDFIPVDLIGPADYLSFQACKETGSAVGNIEIKQYVNNEWKFIDDANPGTDWRDYGYTLDESATKVGFFTSSGSYSRYFQNVQVTRKTYLRPSVSSLALPQATIGKPVSASFDLNWSTCSDEIKVVCDNDKFKLNVGKITPSSNRYGTTTITATYDANSGSQSGTIIIYDQSQKIEIPVFCEVKAKLATEIVYTGEDQYADEERCIENLFSVKDENGDLVSDAVITLESSNPDVLEVCGNAGINPHCGGYVTLTATYASDELREGASWSKEIHVVECNQHIVWEQDFRGYIAATDGSINETTELTAYADPTGFDVTYELDAAAQAFARIENGSLLIFGVGTGHIIASVSAGEFEDRVYSANSMMHEIRVRKWGDKCETYALNIQDEEVLRTVWASAIIKEIGDLPESTMEFYAHTDDGSLNDKLTVKFSVDGGESWVNEQKYDIEPKYDWTTPLVANVPEGATHVSFKTQSSLNTYFNCVTIRQKTYLRASVDEISIPDAIVNEPFSRTFTVEYSDVPLIQHSVTNNHDLGLTITPANNDIDNVCGDYGNYTFTLTGESPYPQTEVNETIFIYTSAGDIIEIPVIVTATLSEPFYFNIEDGDWNESTNWTYLDKTDHGLVPNKKHPVVISKALTISDELVVYGVKIVDDGSVNIAADGGLTVHAGGFENVTENNFKVYNNKEGAGFVRVSKYFKKLGGEMPKMKVHFTTKANMNAGGNKDAAWQYIGAPGAETEMQVVNTSTLYLRSEAQGWVRQWSSNIALIPFAGYAFTQKDQPKLEFAPRLVTDNQTISLTYTEKGMKGDNLWANSYMAPIDIKKLTDSDFNGNVDKIVYLYNAGSWKEWNKDQSAISSAEELPGRYYAIPVGSARALDATYDQTVIPPMQGVYMTAGEGGGSLTLNYEKHVWNCASDDMNHALRIAGKKTVEDDYLNTILRVRLQLNSENSGADRMYLIQDSACTDGYDNGYDAPKQMMSELMNIYTNEAHGKMEISATDQIDGMYLGFTAGEDSEYTITFTSLIGDSLYLYDSQQDLIIKMVNDEQYHFIAEPYSINDFRFQILVAPEEVPEEDHNNQGGVTTGVDNISKPSVWVNQDKLYVANSQANSTIAIYTASGMLVAAPYTIKHTPCTINIAHLPAGVYVLRLNDQAYKFICE